MLPHKKGCVVRTGLSAALLAVFLTMATGYLNYLYSPAGQNIAAKNFYRPRNAQVLAKYSKTFKPLKLVTISQEFGGWPKTQKVHFDNAGVFDQIVAQNAQTH